MLLHCDTAKNPWYFKAGNIRARTRGAVAPGYVHDPCVNMLLASLPKAKQECVEKNKTLDQPNQGPSP